MANKIIDALKKKAMPVQETSPETIGANLDAVIAENPQTVPEMDAVFDKGMEEIKLALFFLVKGYEELKVRIDAMQPMEQEEIATETPTEETQTTEE